MILGAEIGLLVYGIYALATGKYTIKKDKVLEGTPARISGCILMLTLPLAMGIGLFLGILVGLGLLPTSIESMYFLVDVFAIFATIIVANVYANSQFKASEDVGGVIQ